MQKRSKMKRMQELKAELRKKAFNTSDIAELRKIHKNLTRLIRYWQTVNAANGLPVSKKDLTFDKFLQELNSNKAK